MTQAIGIPSTGRFRLGVLGGSFDPIHKGHLTAAAQVAKALDLDRVLFVPAGNQWQKTQSAEKAPTSAEHRLEMTRLAIAGNPLFGISSIDVDRGGPTYSVDTLTELTKLYPNVELFFILGVDALAGIESWKDFEKLFELATFVAVSRPGSNFQVPDKYADRIRKISIDALDISSTSIRDLASAGKGLESTVPAGVITYIKENNLYKEAE